MLEKKPFQMNILLSLNPAMGFSIIKLEGLEQPEKVEQHSSSLWTGVKKRWKKWFQHAGKKTFQIKFLLSLNHGF